MNVHDLMTMPVATCTPESDLASVAMEMWRNDCGAVPVVAADGKVVGIITDRDICMAAATQHNDISRIPVSSVALRPVTCCRPDDDLDHVLMTMGEQQVRRLPVVDDENRLMGIVSINDLILCADREGANSHSRVSVDSLVDALKRISSHWLPVAAHGTPPTRGKKVRTRRVSHIF